MIMKEAVYHRIGQNWSYAYDEHTLHIRIRTKKNDVASIQLCCGDKYNWELYNENIEMVCLYEDDLFHYWQGEVTPKYRRLSYYFNLHGFNNDIWYYLENGFFINPPENKYEGLFDFPYLNKRDVHIAPSWVKEAIFYQIFPERFANGDATNDPENVLPWGGVPTSKNFFGGDLQGVIDHLDYLSQLGINAIYFNPLFEATTNHKYDTTNYLKVDPHFGTNEKLKELVKLCHDRGIRVMLDCVFNHSGSQFAPFLDVCQKGDASVYKDWFYVNQYPPAVVDGIPTYETFAFEPLMPKLNTSNEEVKNYLLEVGSYWIKELGIDGWRLDVANEVDHHFWREFRQAIKGIDPNIYILGEIMYDSITWLQGDQFDAVMNYPFTNAVLYFFTKGKINALQFSENINHQLARYPQQVNEVLFNLLGSHDTVRLLTNCDGNIPLMKLATLFQLTFIGTPCIYYGDEIGLDGGYDPLNRSCMEWNPEKQNQELLTFFKDVIKLRKTYRALSSSHHICFNHVKELPQLLIYERWDEDDHFIIIINNENCDIQTRFTPTREEQWSSVYGESSFSQIDSELNIQLPSYGFMILQASLI